MKYITALHGNEPLPTFALADLGIPQIVGNPLALTLGARFVDSDLNSSFGVDGENYEQNRARSILNKISLSEIVIDFHTTSANTEPFVIIVDLSQVELAKTVGFKHIVYMKYSPKLGHALINHRKGISLEVGDHQSIESFNNTQAVVKNIGVGKAFSTTLYEVYDKIDQPGDYKNFCIHSSGFVPVLAGSTAYQSFGFKSRIISI